MPERGVRQGLRVRPAQSGLSGGLRLGRGADGLLVWGLGAGLVGRIRHGFGRPAGWWAGSVVLAQQGGRRPALQTRAPCACEVKPPPPPDTRIASWTELRPAWFSHARSRIFPSHHMHFLHAHAIRPRQLTHKQQDNGTRVRGFDIKGKVSVDFLSEAVPARQCVRSRNAVLHTPRSQFCFCQDQVVQWLPDSLKAFISVLMGPKQLIRSKATITSLPEQPSMPNTYLIH